MSSLTKVSLHAIPTQLSSIVLAVTSAILCGCTGGSGDSITLATDSQSEDPVVLEIPVAYIKRPLPEQTPDLRDPLGFQAGARLLVKPRSDADAPELDVTDQIAEIVAAEENVDIENIAVDIKGLESSFDGKTLIFAVRAVPEPVDANLETTTWNLWTFDIETQTAQYLIPSRIKRNEGVETGGGQDIDPHFLTDDRIVFSSTRQVASQARLLDEGRGQIFSALEESGNQPAAVLHIYDPLRRNAEFEQISFNLSHDLDPVLLDSGEILFSRWNNTSTNHISLFRIDPSGLELSPVYGYHSQQQGSEGAPIEYTQPRQLDDGRLLSVARNFRSATLGGEILLIDAAGHAEFDQPIWADQGAVSEGHSSLTDTEIRTDGLRSNGGQYGAAYPLRDGSGRLLVTWSDCRVVDADAPPADPDLEIPPGRYLPCTLQPENSNIAPPLYGAWIFDPAENTQRPVVLAQEGFQISEVIAAEPRNFPQLAAESLSFDSNLAIARHGRLLIDSVYDVDGVDNSPLGIAEHALPGSAAFTARPARFLRIVQPVPIPDPEVFEIPDFAFGVTRAFSFREIAGYVPVEPDGSVTVTVAADRPFNFSVVDINGRRIGPRHNYWLQVRAGEVLQCTGCHTANNPLPHGRLDSQPNSANPGARALASGTLGFPGTAASELFGTEPGQTMAEVWDFHQPADNPALAARELSISQSYQDQWHGPSVPAEASILDRDYDPAWTGIPADKPLLVANLDPGLPGRVVINYLDHIQPIWERTRDAIDNGSGVLIDRCTGCHSGEDPAVVAAGQLDLSAVPSADEPDHLVSYRELLAGDLEQWLSDAGTAAPRQRVCTSTDADGNILTTTEFLPLAARMRAGTANGSLGFFDCFEGGRCGPNEAPPLPDNCTEEGGTVVPATANTIDHSSMLSPSELRLLSEWLDIGGQYYNNPFDSRLGE